MSKNFSFSGAIAIMNNSCGIVMPVYFPDGVDAKKGVELLHDNVAAYLTVIDDPADILLSVDGNKTGEDAAKKLSSELGVSMVAGPVNKGKLNAIRRGTETLLARGKKLEHVVVVDQDGDHFANELLNFIRVAEHIRHETGDDRVLVTGRRVSKHKPMGFPRGELEEFADRVLLDALHHNAALSGRPLRMEYANVHDEYPDFHSGFKLFSSRSAADIFLAEPRMAGVSDTCYYRHACEAVMAVEALESGAYLGIVNRSTCYEQPVSTFGLYNRRQLVADKIIWPCKRLNSPPEFVAQWMDNHISRLQLFTLAPDGVGELMEIRSMVLEAFGLPPGRKLLRPLFV